MKKPNLIQVFEHHKLLIDGERFKHAHWEALGKYASRHGNRFFDLLYNGVKFKEYVGVIQVGDLTIEVLPKTDNNDSPFNMWQDVLLSMLRECNWLQVHAHEKAHLKLKHRSILEAYLEMYLNACEQLLREGLVKKYRKERSNLPIFKGKLLFSKHIQANLVHQERSYTEHTQYDRNNIYNQIILKALRLIPELTASPLLLNKLSRILMDFPECKDISVNPQIFQTLTYDRKTIRYEGAIEIAAMLLLNYRPDIRGGKQHVLAILFDMNKLWEEYFFRRLQKSVPDLWTVQHHRKKQFWALSNGGGSKLVEPDVVITTADGQKVVIDTKWKVPESGLPADQDLKQIYIYNEYWSSRIGILLYPQGDYTNFQILHESEEGYFIARNAKEKKHSLCYVSKINILAWEVINKEFTRPLVEGITERLKTIKDEDFAPR